MAHISPRIDVAFKKIFGVEENKDLLISLINSVVSQADQVDDLILLNPYNPVNFMGDKQSILDIKAKSKTGKQFNIEIQITDEANYDSRALYCWAKLYTEQLKGHGYELFSKIIGIHILHFISILGSDQYHNMFCISEEKTGELYFKDIELHTIELKKFSGGTSQEIDDLISKIKNSLDIWVSFLTRHALLGENKDRLPKELNQHPLKRALEVLDIMNLSEEERDTYENRLKWMRLQASALKKMEEKSIEKGMEKGIEIGLEIGEAKVEKMVIQMLHQQLDLNIISQITGLSVNTLLEKKRKIEKETCV